MNQHRYSPTTQRGHPLGVAISAVQKAIRRGDAQVACHFAFDVAASGFWRYLWHRLLIISAEDVSAHEPVTQEIVALANCYATTAAKTPHRIFIAKAVLLLAKARKCRDADHLCVLSVIAPELEAQALVEAAQERCPVPEYAYDVHTRVGRARGKTREQFIVDEFDALNPREQGQFDFLAENVRSKP